MNDHKQCTKIGFDGAAEADRYLKKCRQWQKYKRFTENVPRWKYRCPNPTCRKWHVTSKPPPNKKRPKN